MTTYKPYSPYTFSFPKYGRATAIGTLLSLPDGVVFDLETTGIGKKAEVTEIACVQLYSGRVLLNTLVKPVDLASFEGSKASEVSGIAASDLYDAPSLNELWPTEKSIFNQEVYSFNLVFDGPILRNSLRKHGITPPALAGLCIMRLAQVFYELDFYPSLEEIAALAGIDQQSYGEAHNALADTMVAREILLNMREIAIEEGE